MRSVLRVLSPGPHIRLKSVTVTIGLLSHASRPLVRCALRLSPSSPPFLGGMLTRLRRGPDRLRERATRSSLSWARPVQTRERSCDGAGRCPRPSERWPYMRAAKATLEVVGRGHDCVRPGRGVDDRRDPEARRCRKQGISVTFVRRGRVILIIGLMQRALTAPSQATIHRLRTGPRSVRAAERGTVLQRPKTCPDQPGTRRRLVRTAGACLLGSRERSCCG